jgi:hypothetical protein
MAAMSRLVRSLALIALALVAASPVSAGPRAVVELFTSQGCSSCPPADRLLGELSRDPGLLALSLPVDYWDYLGWHDTLARHEFTQRQQDYADRRGDRAVYTPQIVINGLKAVVGSRRQAVEAAIAATAGTLRVPVAIADSPGGYIVAIGPGAGPAEVWLLPIQRSARVAIGRGENGGATVTYANVVRAMRQVGTYRGGQMTLTLTHAEASAPGADSFAVIVQERAGALPGAITGAALRP